MTHIDTTTHFLHNILQFIQQNSCALNKIIYLCANIKTEVNMRKTNLLLSLLLLPLTSTMSFAQDKASGVPSVEITTQGQQDEGRLLTFYVYTKEKGIYVDFGNGNTREYPWAGNLSFSDRTYGETIKIYSLSADDPIQLFSCSDDSIKSISLNAPGLKILRASGNLLTEIDLTKSPLLEEVYLNKNNLSKFNFPEGTELKYLDVSQNKLEAIDVSNSNKMEYLDASVNNMRAPLNLKWSTSQTMKHFDISCNMFTNLDNIPTYSDLEYFAFNHNKIKVADLTKYPKLKTLKMQYNTNLASTDFSKCPDLLYLDATGTKITDLNLKSNKNLETLKASLLTLSTLDLSNCTELKSLTAEKCYLKEFDFSANTKLKNIDIAGNELTKLDLSKNVMLNNINCSSNKLETLEVGQLAKLDTLNCSINYIKTLDISKNTALKSLNCASNNIAELNIKNCKDLLYVNCADNNIENLTFSAQLDIVGGSVSGNNMNKEALDALFTSLPDINGIEIESADALWKGIMSYSNNPGSATADATTLEAKGWKGQASSDALGDASAMAVFSPDIVGTKVSFAIDCAADIIIDWGDGSKKTYKYDSKSSSYQNFEDVLQGTTMKIYAPEATSFGIANASVAQINVSNMPKLKSLACSRNAITELDLSKNEALEQLTCNNNPLIYLNLGEAKALKNLYCGYTQIKSLDFTNCKNLKYLDVENNRLKELNLTGCENLETINAPYNDLTEIDLSKSPKLTTFYADKNQLKHLDLSNNVILEKLSVEKNQLETLDVKDLKELVYLYCDNNNLKELNVTSEYIKVLQAHENQISSFSLGNAPCLNVLSLNKNQLTSVDLSSCPVLQQLWLNDNKITSVTYPESKLPKCTTFNVSNNLLEDIDFSVVPNATEIAASDNKLTGEVDLSSCSAVEKFFGSDNEIESIKFSDNSGITTLIVSNNKLKSLNVTSENLYWLEANNNELAGVNVSASTNLFMISLNNNKINSLNLSGKTSVFSVSLKNNTFESNALDRLYGQLPDITGSTISPDYDSWAARVFVEGNPGAEAADYTILTNKGWRVDVKGASAIDNISNKDASVAYDKASGCIDFAGKDVKNVRIISLNGAVMNAEMTNDKLNLQNLPNGMYIINANVDGKTFTQKIVK